MSVVKGARGLYSSSSVRAGWDKPSVCGCKEEETIPSELWVQQNNPCFAGQDPEAPGFPFSAV